MSKAEPGHTYRHYKGNLYRVVMIATHTETMEPLVIYTDDEHIWARPLAMFEEQIERDGILTDRFARLD
ncbi:MAG: DUF1653 domain-containing protein [Solobacterium sp.]|nr:DUF1653 domain-containing protein [Solobacterium sp.]